MTYDDADRPSAINTPMGRVSHLRAPETGGMVATVRIGKLPAGTSVVIKWGGTHPASADSLAAEATALECLAEAGLPMARLLHAKPGMTVTTRLPGRIDLDRADHDHLSVLADQLGDVRAAPSDGFGPFESWVARDAVPPEWRDHGLGPEAIALAAEPVPGAQRCHDRAGPLVGVRDRLLAAPRSGPHPAAVAAGSPGPHRRAGQITM
ncbi:MAG: hypothetical protein L0G99_01775 [Propionibacteriales bacterium]|nr:hypothetical protein [Propionibacteriales bacterium]